MDTRYLSLAAGLAIVGFILFRSGRRMGHTEHLPLVANLTGKQRVRARLYFSILAVLILILTGAIGVWSILSEQP